jgi:hypothetical protein
MRSELLGRHGPLRAHHDIRHQPLSELGILRSDDRHIQHIGV